MLDYLPGLITKTEYWTKHHLFTHTDNMIKMEIKKTLNKPLALRFWFLTPKNLDNIGYMLLTIACIISISDNIIEFLTTKEQSFVS